MTTAGRLTVAPKAGSPPVRGESDVAVQLGVDGVGNKAMVERVVHRKIAWLLRHFPGITSCRVAIDVPHRRRRSGRLHRVRIGVVVQGTPVSATRSPSLATHENAILAVHDAFAAMHGELSDRAQGAHRR